MGEKPGKNKYESKLKLKKYQNFNLGEKSQKSSFQIFD